MSEQSPDPQLLDENTYGLPLEGEMPAEFGAMGQLEGAVGPSEDIPWMNGPEQPPGPPGPSEGVEYEGAGDETVEVQKRDLLSMCLMDSAESMAKAAQVARSGNDAEAAEKYARAAKALTEAHIALDPLEERDDAEEQSAEPDVPLTA